MFFNPTIEKIKKWGSEKNINKLIKVLNQKVKSDRFVDPLLYEKVTAANILGDLKSVEAIDALESVLKDPDKDPELESNVIKALGNISHTRCANLLVQKLVYGHACFAPEIVTALIKQGKDALPIILNAMNYVKVNCKNYSPCPIVSKADSFMAIIENIIDNENIEHLPEYEKYHKHFLRGTQAGCLNCIFNSKIIANKVAVESDKSFAYEYFNNALEKNKTIDAKTAVKLFRRLNEKDSKDLLLETLPTLKEGIDNTYLKYEILLTLTEFGLQGYSEQLNHLRCIIEKYESERNEQFWDSVRKLRLVYETR